MPLTPDQISHMDQISGAASSAPASGLTPDQIAHMDQISGASSSGLTPEKIAAMDQISGAAPEPGFVSRIGTDIMNRSQETGGMINRAPGQIASGEKTPLGAVGDIAMKSVGGLISDVGNEVIGSAIKGGVKVIDAVTPDPIFGPTHAQDVAQNRAAIAKFVEGNPIGQMGINAAKSAGGFVGDQWKSFKEKFPAQAEHIEALGDLVNAAGVVEGAGALAGPAKSLAAFGGDALESAGADMRSGAMDAAAAQTREEQTAAKRASASENYDKLRDEDIQLDDNHVAGLKSSLNKLSPSTDLEQRVWNASPAAAHVNDIQASLDTENPSFNGLLSKRSQLNSEIKMAARSGNAKLEGQLMGVKNALDKTMMPADTGTWGVANHEWAQQAILGDTDTMVNKTSGKVQPANVLDTQINNYLNSYKSNGLSGDERAALKDVATNSSTDKLKRVGASGLLKYAVSGIVSHTHPILAVPGFLATHYGSEFIKDANMARKLEKLDNFRQMILDRPPPKPPAAPPLQIADTKLLPSPENMPTLPMTADEIAIARAKMERGNAAGTPDLNKQGEPIRPAAPGELFGQSGRAPQSSDDLVAQKQAQDAFALAERQRQRLAGQPDTLDTQAAGRPKGVNPQDVVLDQGFPVAVHSNRVVPDTKGNMVNIATVQRYDPRTGELDPHSQPYEVPTGSLKTAKYANAPRQAEDFMARAEGPPPPENPRMAGQPVTREPNQTFRATAPDDNTQFPGAGGGRSPIPEQPEGPGPWKSASDAEKWFQEEQSRRAQGAYTANERARDQAAQDAYKDAPASRNPQGKTDGKNWNIDEFGYVKSNKGGPIRFPDAISAARWIVKDGQAGTEQVMEPAVHPSGKGYTVRESRRTTPPPNPVAEHPVPAVRNPEPSTPPPGQAPPPTREDLAAAIAGEKPVLASPKTVPEPLPEPKTGPVAAPKPPVVAPVAPKSSIPQEAIDIVNKYDTPEAFVKDAIEGKNDILKIRSGDEVAVSQNIDALKNQLKNVERRGFALAEKLKGKPPTKGLLDLQKKREALTNQIAYHDTGKNLTGIQGIDIQKNRQSLTDFYHAVREQAAQDQGAGNGAAVAPRDEPVISQPKAAPTKPEEVAISPLSTSKISVADNVLDREQAKAYAGQVTGVNDLSGRPTGWKLLQHDRGAYLINPDTGESKSFVALNEKSGADFKRANVMAQSYAIDNPLEKSGLFGGGPKPEFITKPLFEKAPPPEAETPKSAPKPPDMLQDAGEKIGGARKDRWAERGLRLSDLNGMTGGEESKYVTKDAAWPKPDYAKLVADGMDPHVAAMLKNVRDGLGARPRVDTPEGRRAYVEIMNKLNEIAPTLRTKADFAKMRDTIVHDVVGIPHGASWYSLPKDQTAKYFSIFKGRTEALRPDYQAERKAAKMVDNGFPEATAPWTRRFDVTRRMTDGEETYVVKKKGEYSALDSFSTRAEAEARAKDLYSETLGRDRNGEKQIPDRPHLENIERTGPDMRNGKDATGESFLHDFGFRGMEYGNWAASDERQKLTNYAFDGLHDLARVLNVPPETLSLDGKMGLALGARGSGRFAAHYEPAKLVINMTKTSGAGSLAHEWGHALDHYFGELDRPDAYGGAARGASGWYKDENYSGNSPNRLPNVRPEVKDAFDGVMQALFKTNKDKAAIVRERELGLEKAQASLAAFEKSKKSAAYGADKKFTKDIDNGIDFWKRGIIKRQEALAESKGEHFTPTGTEESSFYKEAKKLTGGAASGYWTRPTELFARAFESYVQDKIAAEGLKSDYLVHGTEGEKYAGPQYKGNPYPVGPERMKINKAFDKLFQAMKTRPGSGGKKALYSTAALAGAGGLAAYGENQ